MVEQDDLGDSSPASPNRLLASLLDIADSVIAETRSTASGKSLSALEAELIKALSQQIPDAKFMVLDIRQWATDIAGDSPSD